MEYYDHIRQKIINWFQNLNFKQMIGSIYLLLPSAADFLQENTDRQYRWGLKYKGSLL